MATQPSPGSGNRPACVGEISRGERPWYVHPPDTVVIELYTPDDNGMEISETVSERRVDLCVDEGLDIVIMPLREKPIPEAP
jgi:hypothetical protein